MMMLSEIATALNASHIGPDVRVQSVGTDSRAIANEQLFVAIKGEHFDGNTFAPEAIKLGAAAVLVSDANLKISPAILVKDTRLALGELAHYWRQKFDLPVVAITGSNGKTTVKEMIAAILNAAKGKVLATKGNLNNDIGMPLTLLNLRAEHTYAVIEMGMNHLNEIRYLSKIACPQVAVINNAGTAHIGELGSREAIAQAKGEIFEGLSEDGIAIINADDTFYDYWIALNPNRKVITFGLDKKADLSATYEMFAHHTQLALKTPEGDITFNMGVLGKHNVSNALAASAVAVALGIANRDIAQGLSQFDGVQGRLRMHTGYQHAVVIDDTYNANPDSMIAAIDVLVAQKSETTKKLVFVMGDMAELGEQTAKMHEQIGQYAKQKAVSRLLSFGDFSQLASENFGAGGQHFGSLEALITAVKAVMQADACVLVKGSRSMKMERVVQAIVNSENIKGVY
jgi:UDP-N-acetylmuramoyl-tripeptide--D-alanyl-D-alanine ligase